MSLNGVVGFHAPSVSSSSPLFWLPFPPRRRRRPPLRSLAPNAPAAAAVLFHLCLWPLWAEQKNDSFKNRTTLMILILRGLNSKTFWCKIFSTCVCYLKIKYIYDALKVSHLHLDIEDSSFLLNPLLYGGHGLVEHRQTLCALQSRGGHDISGWCDQIYLKKKQHVSNYRICKSWNWY